jgi:hypothetical protein
VISLDEEGFKRPIKNPQPDIVDEFLDMTVMGSPPQLIELYLNESWKMDTFGRFLNNRVRPGIEILFF